MCILQARYSFFMTLAKLKSIAKFHLQMSRGSAVASLNLLSSVATLGTDRPQFLLVFVSFLSDFQKSNLRLCRTTWRIYWEFYVFLKTLDAQWVHHSPSNHFWNCNKVVYGLVLPHLLFEATWMVKASISFKLKYQVVLMIVM